MHGYTHGKGTVVILGRMAALLVSAVLFSGLPAAGSGPETTRGAPTADKGQGVQLQKAYGQLPLYFIENRGQVDPQVKFYEQGSGRTVWFTQEDVWFSLRRLKGGEEAAPAQARRGRARRGLPQRLHLPPPPSLGGRDWLRQKFTGLAGKLLNPLPPVIPPEGLEIPVPKEPEWETVTIRQTPVGLRPGVKIKGLERQEHRVNYFLGNDPKKWRTDIPTYQAVVYKNAYAGIDLKFYGQGRRMEYDIVVQPGADPGRVQFAYQGVERLEVTPEGDLALVLPGGGRLLQKKPLVYQDIAGQRVPVAGKYRLCRSGARVTCGFAVAAYDKQRPLVIDPVLVYSTYLGGSCHDYCQAIAVDATGAVYVTGQTDSFNFPTQQAYQGSKTGSYDVFITKLSPEGNALVYSTYLGGIEGDYGYGIAVDAAGAAYVVGETWSGNFPINNWVQQYKFGILDAFVSKLSPMGNTLVYSTYLGGSTHNSGRGIGVDAAGAAYVTGFTDSTNFWTHNAYQSSLAGSNDAFITKLSPAGNTLIYSTYLGGSGLDGGEAIAVDATGAVYVAGDTESTNFPTQQAYQGANAGIRDAFVTKLSPSGNTLAYCTYLGGDHDDNCSGIAVNAAGAAYVTGFTASDNFPTRNALQAVRAGGSDAFVTKLAADGRTLVYSTYLAGSNDDFGTAIAVDVAGAAYIAGYTLSTDFPMAAAVQPALAGSRDAFVSKLTPSGDALVYSTYLGGSGDDLGYGIAVDPEGSAYLVGGTYSDNFPISHAFQPALAGTEVGWMDGFVVKLEGVAPILPARYLIDYGNALDNHLLTFNSGGQAFWFNEVVLFPLADYARSGYIGDYQYSWLQTTVNGPGELSFDWKISSQAYHDLLQVWVDGAPLYQTSGDVDWRRVYQNIPVGFHLIQWRYVKDGSGNAGSDCAWLDKVVFAPSGISLPQALDNRILTFHTGGDQAWSGQSSTSYYGGSAARSGPIGHNQSSWLETLVAGPGEISFFWKVSSQMLSDVLSFSINGQTSGFIHGSSDWQQRVFSLQDGWNNLRWTYRKDGSGAAGQDCGWLDKVVVTSTAATNLNNVLDNQELGFETGGDLPWTGRVVAYPKFSDFAACGSVTHNQHSWLKTVVTGPGTVAFSWKVSCEEDFDGLEFYLDGAIQEKINGEVDWKQKKMFISPGDHALVWLYVKDSQISAGDDRGYVDQVVFTPAIMPPLTLLLE